jgi:hypothetical protein
MKLSDLFPDEKKEGFSDEEALKAKETQKAKEIKPADMTDAVKGVAPGQSKYIEPSEFVREPTIAVQSLFSPTNGPTDKEWARIAAHTFTTEEIENIEHWTGRSWKFDFRPVIVAFKAREERAKNQAKIMAEQVAKEEIIARRGKVFVKCDCTEGRWLDASRVSVTHDESAIPYINCNVCGARFRLNITVGKRL